MNYTLETLVLIDLKHIYAVHSGLMYRTVLGKRNNLSVTMTRTFVGLMPAVLPLPPTYHSILTLRRLQGDFNCNQ